MLNMKAQFTHKPDCFYPCSVVIEKVVKLSGFEFDRLVARPLEDWDFIAENRDYMWLDKEKYHCLLALGENRSDALLIEAEGYGYARKASYLPSGRILLERELELAAEHIIKNAVPDEKTCSWVVWFSDLTKATGLVISEDNGISSMLMDTLRKRAEIAEIDLEEDNFEITGHPEFYRTLTGSSLNLSRVGTPDTDITEALWQRVRENMLALERDWHSRDIPWLIAHAKEIAATKQAYNDIFAYAHEEHMAYLLRFANPLEMVRDAYVNGLAFSQEAEACCTITQLIEKGYIENGYIFKERSHSITEGPTIEMA